MRLLLSLLVATGLAGGRTGTRVVEELTAEAILNDFVRIDDESRTSTAVVDPTGNSYTEINEWGPEVTAAELDTLLEKLHYLARGADFVVLHNPNAGVSLGPDLFSWCEQMYLRDLELYRERPSQERR